MGPRQKIVFTTFSSCYCRRPGPFIPTQRRWISTTTPLESSSSWMNKIKGVLTGNKDAPTESSETASTSQAFTLLRFAEEMKTARRLGKLKNYVVGRSSEATFADAFEKHEAIIRVLGGFDPTGDNIQVSQKQEAAKKCNCTIADVENTLAKFTWAKEAHKKVEKLKEEGKPVPTNLAEIIVLKIRDSDPSTVETTVGDGKVKFLAKPGKKKNPFASLVGDGLILRGSSLREANSTADLPVVIYFCGSYKRNPKIQKMMGSTPLDVARSNLAKSGQISRNALCPCGSKKRYKRCCGKD